MKKLRELFYCEGVYRMVDSQHYKDFEEFMKMNGIHYKEVCHLFDMNHQGQYVYEIYTTDNITPIAALIDRWFDDIR